MSTDEVLKEIKTEKAIAIIRGVELKDIINTVKALVEGGFHNVEITFDHSCKSGINETLEKIRSVKNSLGDRVFVGAGTVLTPEEAELAAEAGAEFMISPDTNINVIKRTKEIGKISIPGALTPSEITAAYYAGADIIKLYPAGNMGASYLKAVKAPLVHIPMYAVGGIKPEDIESYMKAGADGFGIGGNLVPLDLIRKGEFDRITEIARRYTKEIARCRKM